MVHVADPNETCDCGYSHCQRCNPKRSRGASMTPTLMDTNWAPLISYSQRAPAIMRSRSEDYMWLSGHYMWMYGGEIDGQRVDAYKHIDSRDYLYLLADGTAV